MCPQPAHAREVVLELCQLDLELALGAAGVAGEDVEDDRGAVDDRDAELGLERSLLARRELVVAGDHVGIERGGELLELLELAGPQIAVGVRMVAALDQVPDDRDARGAQQLAELDQIDLLGRGRDTERALDGAALGRRSAVAPHGLTAPGARRRRGSVLIACGAHRASVPSRSTASVSRSSGVVSEIRKNPSPLGPYAPPGESTTAASSSTYSQYAAAFSNPSGTGAQM